MRAKTIVIILSLLFFLFLLPATADARDLFVMANGDPSNLQFPALGMAVASANDGDVIYLVSGEFDFGLNIDRAITIDGGSGCVSIDGSAPYYADQRPGQGWEIMAPGCTIRNVGFLRWQGVPVTVEADRCVLDNCRFSDGTGGLVVRDGSAKVINCSFDGGADRCLVTSGVAKVEVRDCTFSDNREISLGGSSSDIADSTLNNVSIDVCADLVTIANTSIRHGQIRLDEATNLLVSGCDIDGSNAMGPAQRYDCIRSESGTGRNVEIRDCSLGNGGSGIVLGTMDSVRIANCSFSGFHDSAIALSRITNFYVSGCHIRDYASDGIRLVFCSDGNVGGDAITGPGQNGVSLQQQTEHIDVTGCDIRGNRIGISEDSTCRDNTFKGNTMNNTVDLYRASDAAAASAGNATSNTPTPTIWDLPGLPTPLPTASATAKPAPGPAMLLIGLAVVAGAMLCRRNG